MEFLITLVTSVVLLVFFYYQDRNKEPVKVLIEAFVLGFAVSLQIDWIQSQFKFSTSIFVHAFILAVLVEEGVKLGVLRVTLFRSKYFTEKVDGITYAVFTSIGFATAENLFIALTVEEAIVRSFTAVPAHALFAVSMGYYLGWYKFDRQIKWLVYALVIPVLFHGLYNFLIMSDSSIGIIVFIPYMVFLWVRGTIRISRLNRKVGDKE